MSVLAKNEIISRLNKYKTDSIIVTPLLNKDTQINQIGIDCRLSNQFIILKTQHIESFDIKKQDVQRQFQEELVVPFGYGFILHPQSMVLGSTFEFISLPNDVVASIEGRSSWARMGLMIATAVYVEPGFKGCITLELSNVSNIPIKLYPGMRIGQIIFSKTSSPSKYENKKYQFAIGPEISKIKNDPDTSFFVEFGISHDKDSLIDMKNIKGVVVQAKLKSGVLEEKSPFHEGYIYYINAELFPNGKNIGERRLDIAGRPSLISDERIKPGLYCKVEITSDLFLSNIIID